MFKTLKIKNIQSHVNTIVKFSPGFNVITGFTDAGKSVIARAITWLYKNQPSAVTLKNWYSKKNDNMEASLVVENKKKDVCITKTREGDTSSYSVDNQNFDVVNRDVPTEVSDALNISDLNVLTQHDAYSLLKMSPGKLAKALNDLAGLSILDSAFKKLNSDVNALKDRKLIVSQSIVSLNNNIKELDYVKTANESITRAEELEGTITASNNKIQKIGSILQICASCERKKEETESLLKAESEIDFIQGILETNKKSEIKIRQLENILYNISESTKEREDVNKCLKQTQEKLKRFLKTNKICPICGESFTDATIERMTK